MPFSYNRYTSTADQTIFNITVQFLSTSHLSVTVDGVTQSSGVTIAGTSGSGTATFDTAPASGSVVIIQRTTPKTKANFQDQIVNFADGSVLTETDLDNAVLGLLYIAQEADDSGATNALSFDTTDQQWDAQSKRIKNVSDPTSSLDAVTKQYVDNLSLYGATTAPQAYTLASTRFSTSGSDQVATLGTGDGEATPLSDNDLMYIVEVGGVIQKPTTDYTITSLDGVFTLTLIGTADNPATAPTADVHVRNLGIARSVFAGSVQGDITFDEGTLYVDSTNNRVGVGTTSPQNALHLNSSGDGSNYIQLTNSDTGATNGDGALVGLSSAELLVLANQESNDITLQTAGSDRVRVKADGKVGIGTTTPAVELEVEQSGGSPIVQVSDGTRKLQMGADSNNPFIGTNTAHDLRIISNNTEQMRIKSDGKVGIGTNSPTEKLHIHETDSAAVFTRLTNSGSTTLGTAIGLSSADNTVIQNEIAGNDILFRHVKSGGGSTLTQAARITEHGLHLPNGSATSVEDTAATGLDYYAEGHIVPTFSTGDSTSITLNTSGAKIRYVRIGRLVTLTGRLLVSSGYATGSENNQTAKITNLPFTCLSGTTCTTAVALIGNFDAGGSSISGAIKITQNTKELSIGLMETNNLNLSKGSTFLRTGDELFINISYMASDTE